MVTPELLGLLGEEPRGGHQVPAGHTLPGELGGQHERDRDQAEGTAGGVRRPGEVAGTDPRHTGSGRVRQQLGSLHDHHLG